MAKKKEAAKKPQETPKKVVVVTPKKKPAHHHHKKKSNEIGKSDILRMIFVIYYPLMLACLALQTLIYLKLKIKLPITDTNLWIDFTNVGTTNIPVDILINGLLIITSIYMGIEGTMSLGKTLTLPAGVSAPMPANKRMWFLIITYSWFVLSILALCVIMFLAVPAEKIGLTNIFTGLVTTTIAYTYARKAKSAAEPFSINVNPSSSAQPGSYSPSGSGGYPGSSGYPSPSQSPYPTTPVVPSTQTPVASAPTIQQSSYVVPPAAPSRAATG